MRVLSTLVLAAIASTAAADDVGSLVSQIPACALPCFVEASTSSGCSVTDYKCMCNNILQVQKAAAGCLATSCEVEDLAKLANMSSQLCQAITGTSGTANASGAVATGSATGTAGSASGAAATGTAPTPAGAGRSVAAVGVAGLAVVAAAALVA
ncbi:hypothetical protein RB594_008643 [Gaeumannomyces avenae]